VATERYVDRSTSDLRCRSSSTIAMAANAPSDSIVECSGRLGQYERGRYRPRTMPTATVTRRKPMNSVRAVCALHQSGDERARKICIGTGSDVNLGDQGYREPRMRGLGTPTIVLRLDCEEYLAIDRSWA